MKLRRVNILSPSGAAIRLTRMRSFACGCTWMVTRAGGSVGNVSLKMAFDPREIGDVAEINRHQGNVLHANPARLQQRAEPGERLPGLSIDVIAGSQHGVDVDRRFPTHATDRCRSCPRSEVRAGRRWPGRDERQLGPDRAGQPRHHHQAARRVDRLGQRRLQRGRLVEARGIALRPGDVGHAEPRGLQRRRDVGDRLRDLRLHGLPHGLGCGILSAHAGHIQRVAGPDRRRIRPERRRQRARRRAHDRDARRDPRSRCRRSGRRRPPAAPRPGSSSAPARDR